MVALSGCHEELFCDKPIEEKFAIILHYCIFYLVEPQCTDMAPLISSLSQVMLDPHYRTFQGFQGLVQREWVAHGHHFASRTGLVAAAEWEQVCT